MNIRHAEECYHVLRLSSKELSSVISSRAIITDFYVIDAVSNYIVYIPTMIFFVFIIYSLYISSHFSTRPKIIMIFSVLTSALMVLQSLAMTTHYIILYIFEIEITVQSCSTAQNFLSNPIIYTSFVIPLDRYLFVAHEYEMPFWSRNGAPATSIPIYSSNPTVYKSSLRGNVSVVGGHLIVVGIGYITSTYNSFFANTIVLTQEVCRPIRRDNRVFGYAFLSQLFCLILTLVFYYLTSRKLRGMLNLIKDSSITKSAEFYKDMKFLKYYCVFTFLPFILVLPAIALSFLREAGYFNKYLWVTTWSILHCATRLGWFLGIYSIRPMRRTAIDGVDKLFCRRRTNMVNVIVNSDERLTTIR